MQKLLRNRKLVISIFVVLILIATLVALGPLFYSIYMGRGVETKPVDAAHTKPASTELDGNWHVIAGTPHNFTSVGFSIDEILPAEKTLTSGSTKEVEGQAVIKDQKVEEGTIVVDMTSLTTDKKVRDQNMKDKLFITREYPEASFKLTEPADLSNVPEDGSLAKVKLTGELTIKDKTKKVSEDFDVVRDDKTIVLGGNIPVNRLDYGIETPELIAAKIAEEGEVNIRVTLEK